MGYQAKWLALAVRGRLQPGARVAHLRPFELLGMPIRGPSPGEIAERLAAVQDWVADWQRVGRGAVRVEYRKLGGRQVGFNLIPCRAWLERQVPGMYVRQMDAPGVDTKFIEGNRGVLTKLLDLQLPSGRVDIGAGDFERRYGFRPKPGYVRFRLNECDGWRELTVRA